MSNCCYCQYLLVMVWGAGCAAWFQIKHIATASDCLSWYLYWLCSMVSGKVNCSLVWQASLLTAPQVKGMTASHSCVAMLQVLFC